MVTVSTAGVVAPFRRARLPRLIFLSGVAAIVSTSAAPAAEFATRAAAMSALASALPKATAANPRYLTKADGTLSQWLTDEISFSTDASGAVEVTMREHYSQTKDGKTVEGRHEAHFSIADVHISTATGTDDVTQDGAPAVALLFTCDKPGCIAAKWGDAASRADKTDIYVQNPATLAELTAAFRRLQAP